MGQEMLLIDHNHSTGSNLGAQYQLLRVIARVEHAQNSTTRHWEMLSFVQILHGTRLKALTLTCASNVVVVQHAVGKQREERALTLESPGGRSRTMHHTGKEVWV